MANIPDELEKFRARMQELQARSGLKDPKFAQSLGLALMTYRTMMGRDPTRPGKAGPSLQTLSSIATHMRREDFNYVLTGETAGEAGGAKPSRAGPGASKSERALLDKALFVLRSDGPLAQVMKDSIESNHRAVWGSGNRREKKSGPAAVGE
ncbi:MAG: hypothetical protein HY910_07265 [Desulfarculus sp.]|nr:hypothetical protein [Desulfarculus sp.]